MLIFIFIIGVAFRFYNLGWGAPFFFHPDERNIAGSVSRMWWEKTLNPQFFAYGSFWSYVVIFLIRITNALYQTTGHPEIAAFIENVFPKDPFSRAIIFLRILSAIQGVGIMIIGWFVGKMIFSQQSAVSSQQSKNSYLQTANCKLLTFLLPFLLATSPGLIQASHFGTFESSLTFLYFLLFYLCLKFWQTRKFRFYFWGLVVFGVSVAIKVTSLILFPVLLIIIFLLSRQQRESDNFQSQRLNVKNIKLMSNIKSLLLFFFFFATLCLVPALIFFISNPFAFSFKPFAQVVKDPWSIFNSDFLGTINYESGVARGTMMVFYTQQFQQTIPVAYQFVKVLPFVLNPVIFILFLISGLYFFIYAGRYLFISKLTRIASGLTRIFRKFYFRRERSRPFPTIAEQLDTHGDWIFLFTTLTFFIVTFFSNAILYVKWTRYIIPSLPYIYILVCLFILQIIDYVSRIQNLKFKIQNFGIASRLFLKSSLLFTFYFLLFTSVIFSVFFTSIYTTDTRVEAAVWAKQNLKPNAKIMSEIYDMGIVPFNEVFHYSQIKLFNFYDLDDKIADTEEMINLKQLIEESDAVILPSRRIADTRLRLAQKYPNGAWFYENLFNGALGFKQAADFSHPYDKILAPIVTPDESFTVFDHPEVLIFVKQKLKL